MKSALASLRRLALKMAGLAALAGTAVLGAAPADAQTRISARPYAEITQVFSVGLDDGDSDAYTGLAVGVDARAKTRRLEGQLSYRYEKRIGWDRGNFDDDVHTGLAQVRADILPGSLSFNAGGLASRSRGDARGPVFGFDGFEFSNTVDVYGVYAGPDFSRRIGGLDVAANYRIGYVKVDDKSLRGLPFAPGQIRLDRYDSSTTHNASLSVGQGVGPLPFGWTLGAGYVREDVGRLDQEYEGRYIRGDVVLPVSHSLALTAGIGYEKIESSQQDFLRDARGLPIVTPGGNLVADPSRPRLTAFESDGLIYEGGIIWRPSRRTELQARAGHRYGGTTFTGSLRHRINSAWGLNVLVYDTIESFGRLVVGDLAAVPLNFNTPGSAFGGGLGSVGTCVFGTDPGTGVCFDQFLQSVTASNFRNRGITALMSGGRGPWTFGVGAGYNNRKYLSPRQFEGTPLRGVREETFTLTASATRTLTPNSSADFNVYAVRSESGLAGVDGATGFGASAGYRRRFYDQRLEGFASVGLFHSSFDNADRTVASALLGLRHNF